MLTLVSKKPLSCGKVIFYGEFCLSKKTSAEEQKKKQAYYYGKGEKKAKAVKK